MKSFKIETEYRTIKPGYYARYKYVEGPDTGLEFAIATYQPQYLGRDTVDLIQIARKDMKNPLL